MKMSVQAQLCRDIIKEEFGPPTATIAHELLLRGRSALSDLTQKTNLPMEIIKESLVVLIQHNIVYFKEEFRHNLASSIDSSASSTYYEIDQHKILLRLRIGRILRVTEEKYGKLGSAVCSLLFLHGRLRSIQVQELLTEHEQQKNEDKYVNVLTKMALEQLIIPVRSGHSRIADIDSSSTRMHPQENSFVVRRIITEEEFTSTEPQSWLIKKKPRAESSSSITTTIASLGIKRKASDTLATHPKRISKDKGAFQSALQTELNDPVGRQTFQEDKNDSLEYVIDPRVYFTINYEKYNILFRNQMLVDLAVSRINRTAGLVLKAILRCGRDKMHSSKEESSPPATAEQIMDFVDTLLGRDIFMPSVETESQDEASKLRVIKEYLELLRTDNVKFVRVRCECESQLYSVDCQTTTQALKEYLLMEWIKDRFGAASSRLVRILLEKHSSTDQLLAKIAMSPIDEVRRRMNHLLQHDFVQIQVVPTNTTTKGSTPSHDVHLYSFSLEKCYQALSCCLYRTIANLQQRKEKEIIARSNLIQHITQKRGAIWNVGLRDEFQKRESDSLEAAVEKIEVAKRRLEEMLMIITEF